MRRLRWVFPLLGLGLVLGSCAGESSDGLRKGVFRALAADPLADGVNPAVGLRVVFVPDFHGCAPQQVEAIAALERFQRDYEDSVVITAVSFADSEEKFLLGHRLPGQRKVVPAARISASGVPLAYPRVEAWGPEGDLLFLKQISFPIDREGFFHELQWLRAQAQS